MGINILVSGSLSSGSSAVVDLLREYENIEYPYEEVSGGAFEFNNLLSRKGMVIDQILNNNADRKIIDYVEFKLKYFEEKYALKSSDITADIYKKEIAALRLLYNLQSSLVSEKSTNGRLEIVKKWMNDLRENYCSTGKHFLIDQPVFVEQKSLIPVWDSIFQDYKWILVHRDPRDQMAQIIRSGTLFKWHHEPKEKVYDGMRDVRFQQHISWIKARLNGMLNLQSRLGDDKVMLVSYENFVKNHEEVKKSIEKFIGVDLGFQKDMGKFLRISESNKYIGIFSKYLNRKEIDCLEELRLMHSEII